MANGWCNQRCLVLLFVLLVSICLIFIAIVYEIPQNFHRMLVQSINNPTRYSLADKNKEKSFKFNEIHYDNKLRENISYSRTNITNFQRLFKGLVKGKRKKSKKKLQFGKWHKEAIPNVPNKYQANELKQRLPNVIIIGSKKAGTRALLVFLGHHPQIKIAQKEIHYFDRNYDNGIDWYLQQMPETYPNEITMEKTPGYFVHPEAPKRVKKMCLDQHKKLKFLVILRNPIQRAISDYTQGLYQQKKDILSGKKRRLKSFEARVLLNGKKRKVNQNVSLIKIGLYANHLKRWLKYFDLRQFHFISGERLVDKPWEELYETQVFLNISIAIKKEIFWFNKTKSFFCLNDTRTENGHPQRKPKCLNEQKGRKHPSVKKSTISALESFFAPYNRELYKMIGRDFGW